MDVKSLLGQYGMRPSKGLGQNFLIADWVVERILEASCLRSDDVVLEVGPGLGTLTGRLAEHVAEVVAIELDRKLLPILSDTLGQRGNVHLVQGDILAIDPVSQLLDTLRLGAPEALSYKVVANLPYYITSHALRHILGARIRPVQIVVMLQREVAERIMAPPGRMSLLSVSVRVFGCPEKVCSVPSSAFYPRPRVDSAVLRIRVAPEPRVDESAIEPFFRVVRAGFGQKRKQLHNSLASGLHLTGDQVGAALERADICAHRRPQTLSVDEWVRVVNALPLASSHGQQGGQPSI